MTENQNPETPEAGIAAILTSRPYKKIIEEKEKRGVSYRSQPSGERGHEKKG